MTNPFEQHRCALFAERDSVDAALHYVHEIIGTLEGADKAAAMTAMMVLVNTAAKLWPEPPTPAADDTAQVRAALAARAADAGVGLDQLVAHELGERIVALDARLSVLEAAPPATPEDMAKAVEAWAASDNLDRHVENWADNYLGDRIETWVTDNLDIEDDVREEVRNVLRDVTVNLDL
jgi:hypothetical protein